MTQQEMIEQNVRMLIGDLQLQLIVARARLAELEQAQRKPNGRDRIEPEERPAP
jgi:hypothetical protein